MGGKFTKDTENTQKTEHVSGTVENIIYQNEQNGYTICDIDSDDGLVTVVGVMPFLSEGESVTVWGVWTNHSSFGRQFKAESYEKHPPTSKESIFAYLSSGAVKGIGPVIASRIVEKYGEDSLDVLENHPEYLSDIKGITAKKAIEIGAEFGAQKGVRNVMLYFNGLFGPATAMKVYKRWGAASVDVIKMNPYILCDEIGGIGFERADKIAETLGHEKGSAFRIAAGTKYALMLGANRNGHCYLPMEQLANEASELLGVERESVMETIINLSAKGELTAVKFGEETAIYLPRLYEAEKYCASKLLTLAKSALVIPADFCERYISLAEKELSISFAQKQKEAIRISAKSGFLIVTGGPGTGKTTVIQAILKIYDSLGMKTLLAAPTGRAAKRMTLSTGRQAKTIHRLLEVEYTDSNHLQFAKDENSPLEADAVIIDETSMLDVLLLSSLLHAIKPGTRLIFIGDSDQLPPVGPGDTLCQMLESEIFDSVRLDEIFRQAKDSAIITNAHLINKGEMPVIDNKSKDFFYIKKDIYSASKTICDLCCERLTKAYGYDSLWDIQVISPTRKGDAGTVTLNKALQERLNPPSKDKSQTNINGVIFREGDKVMQIKNNYMLSWKDDEENKTGVFNGDIGILVKLDNAAEKFVIEYEDKTVEYDYTQFDDIEHAYAITVHKSQGSEYSAVIIPLFKAPPGLMTRNLLYTAVTRAQSTVVCVGEQSAISEMVKNKVISKRYCGLKTMIKHKAET